jgi:hypothetical protein
MQFISFVGLRVSSFIQVKLFTLLNRKSNSGLLRLRIQRQRLEFRFFSHPIPAWHRPAIPMYNVLMSHRAFLAALFLACYSLVTPVWVLAAPPTATPSPMVPIEIEAAAALFQNSGTLENRIVLVEAYEGFITATCMPHLWRYLQHEGKLKDPRCILAVSELLKLDAANPVAICARDGIDTRSCRELFGKQIIAAFPSPTPTSFISPDPSALDAVDEVLKASKISPAKSDEQARPFYNQLQSALTSGDRTNPQFFPFVLELMRKTITSACSLSGLMLRPLVSFAPAATPADGTAPARAPGLGNDPFADNFDGLTRLTKRLPGADVFTSPTATPTPGAVQFEAPFFDRIRLLTPVCLQTLELVRQVAPSFPQAICAREGTASPQCLDARRWERDQNKAPGKEDPKKEFNTF